MRSLTSQAPWSRLTLQIQKHPRLLLDRGPFSIWGEENISTSFSLIRSDHYDGTNYLRCLLVSEHTSDSSLFNSSVGQQVNLHFFGRSDAPTRALYTKVHYWSHFLRFYSTSSVTPVTEDPFCSLNATQGRTILYQIHQKPPESASCPVAESVQQSTSVTLWQKGSAGVCK